jgi:hypothetical protein
LEVRIDLYVGNGALIMVATTEKLIAVTGK